MQPWIASAFALRRFGGLQPCVACAASEEGSSLSLLAMTLSHPHSSSPGAGRRDRARHEKQNTDCTYPGAEQVDIPFHILRMRLSGLASGSGGMDNGRVFGHEDQSLLCRYPVTYRKSK
jgi:hypothetical protein